MKKLKLFLAAMAAMVGLSANAQLTNGTVYWIQDTGSGQFISQGGNWGTQATVQDVGGIGFEAVYVSDGVYKLKNIQFNKVVNVDKGLNIVEHDGYCDQAASDITLTASGDGYLLSAVKGSDTRYIVNNQSNNSYGVKGLGFTTNSAEATVWKFLDKAGYDAAIQAYKDAKAASYATSLGYSAANEAALEAIINDANQFISKDYTSSITNAALNAGNTNGWTATKPNQRTQAFGSENGTMAESWNGCVVATQTVSNLPNGLYKVTFVGTFRPKGSTESEKLTSDQTSSPAYVYANDSKEEFVHWIDVAAKANNRAGVKNNAASYTKAFYTYVTDGTLNLGVKQDTWYEGYMWCPFGLFTLTYYTNQVADEDITALVATIPAEESVPAGVYSNLTSLKNTLENGKTIAAFNNLSSAITEANALVAPYAALLAEIAKAKALGIAAADAEAYANVTTAAEATANTQALMVDEYNYVATTYQYAVDLGAWNASDNAGTMSSQHWDGTAESTYLEQGAGNKAYNLNSWTVTYDQNLNLPAGNYVFKVAGRTASDHVTINLNVTNVSNSNELLGTVNDFPKGDVGLGINKAGATSFDSSDPAGFANNGAGRGWQWRYVKFTLAEAATVKVAVVATADAQYRWMGFCNATVQTDDEANVSLIAYNVALNNAQTVLADATYTNVAGTDKSNLQDAIAADASLDKTDADAIDAATATLNTAASTFTAGVASWNSLVSARAAASGELPYASSSKKTALDNAVAAEATDAADAATKTAAIEQANRQYVESNALAEGVDGATNVTSLITNPDANDGGNGWSGSFGTLEGEQYTQGDGTLGGAYFDKNGASSYNAEQTITNLATGKYLLTVTARAQSISGSYQVKATNSQGEAATGDIATIGNQGGVFGRGWGDASVEFLQKIEGDATIGITASNDGNFWMSFDRFRLVKLRDLTPEESFVAATTEDYAALNAAIEAAEEKTLGFDAGDYAPYNNAAAVATLAAAKAIDQQANNAQADVQAATAALTGATWTANTVEVNAVYDGTFAAAENNGAPKGWRMSNNTLGGSLHARAFNPDEQNRLSEFNETNSGLFLRFDGTNSSRGSMYYYGDTENYTMPLKAGVTYYVKVDVAGWGSTGKPIRMNVTGPEGFTAMNQQFNTSVRADNADNTPQQFFIVFTATVAGNYVINFQTPGADTNTHNIVISNVEVKRVPTLALSEDVAWTPTAYKAANVTLTRTVKADTWSTFVVPFDIDNATLKAQFGDDVEVSTIAATADGLNFEAMATPAITANEPVILKTSEAKSEFTFENVAIKAAVPTKTLVEGVKAIGNYNGKITMPASGDTKYYYIASNKLKYTTGTQTLKGFRAYFEVGANAPAGIKAFFANGDLETAIEGVEADVNVDGTIFNLAGQRVNKAQKGIYIVNGKKVLVK